jgi:hypothetical protein
MQKAGRVGDHVTHTERDLHVFAWPHAETHAISAVLPSDQDCNVPKSSHTLTYAPVDPHWNGCPVDVLH